jgi:hypothetical protein
MNKKGLASLLTAVTLMAGMVTAVPASAEEVKLDLEVNSVWQLCKDKSSSYTKEDVSLLTDDNTETGITINRKDTTETYVNYVIFGNGVDDMAFDKVYTNGNKSVVFGTDDISFMSTIQSATSDISYDKTFKGTVRDAGGQIDELLVNGNNSVTSVDHELDEPKTYKYIILLFNKWENSTVNEIALYNTEEEPPAPEKINVQAAKVEVEGVAEADTNQDAVGYYVENLGITKDTGDLKWQITMNDEAKYEKNVGVGLSVEGEGTMDVSFGIVLTGSTMDGQGTSAIKDVYVTE